MSIFSCLFSIKCILEVIIVIAIVVCVVPLVIGCIVCACYSKHQVRNNKMATEEVIRRHASEADVL